MVVSLPILKVFDIDYSFIIKNYLNPELWNQKWTLFIYKNFVVTLQLYQIDCSNKKITFKLEGIDKDNEELYGWVGGGIFYCNSDTEFAYYSLVADNINILKNIINSSIYKLIRSLEAKLIKCSDEYKQMYKTRLEEKERLREIAREFLDAEKVQNDDIREAYEEWFVDKMEQDNSYLDDYVSSNEFRFLTDVWLIYAKITQDESLENQIKSSVDDDKIQEILEEYEEDMKEGLEDL